MKLKLSDFLFLRTPVYSYTVDQGSALKNLLNDTYFRVAIYVASADLYRQLEKKKHFAYDDLDDKLKDTLCKYLNRMCYRPTPFGLCASFSDTSWNNEQSEIILKAQNISVDLDYVAARYLLKPVERYLRSVARYYPNTTLYSSTDDYRYFNNKNEAGEDVLLFTMLSFAKNRLFKRLFSFCRSGRTWSELKDNLQVVFDDGEEVESFLNDVVSAGILVSDISPNVTGEKYVSRITQMLNGLNHIPQIAAATQLVARLRSIRNVASPGFGALPELASFTENVSSEANHPLYVTCGRNAGGGLNSQHGEQLMELVRCADLLTDHSELTSLTRFRNAFVKRYDMQEVPLVLALDPETGIGYEKLEQTFGDDELLSGLPFSARSQPHNITWGPVQQLLMRKWTHDTLRGRFDPVEITDADLGGLPVTKPNYPPSLSVVFRVVNDTILLEQAGGVTANTLTGRFTLYNEATLQQNCRITELEEEANPGVILAEVAYLNHEHAANINTRSHFRKYEIPVGCHSTLPEENQIGLHDLMVSVAGDQIVLRSNKLNRIVVPRHSTAYNHQLSQLPVFRFLGDLQYQSVKSNLTVDLMAIFPGLNFYPRLTYKSHYLTVATWILKREEIEAIVQAMDSRKWKEYAATLGLSRYFALTTHDNQLIFDLQDDHSVSFFLRTVKNKESITLKEFLMPDTAGIAVKDENGQGFIGQFVAALYNTEPSFNIPEIRRATGRKVTTERDFLPGKEWLYFKIYCHNHLSDRILTKEVGTIIRKLKKLKVIESWFFVRYYDPDHHIRLRFRVNGSAAIGQIMDLMNSTFEELSRKGSVSDIVIDTYSREVERYGQLTVSQVEQVFFRSSEVTIGYLKNRDSESQEFSRLQHAVLAIDDIFKSMGIARATGRDLLEQMYTHLWDEFDAGKPLKVELDNRYRRLSKAFGSLFAGSPVSNLQAKRYARFIRELVILGNRVDLAEQRHSLAADLIHMHLNRIFPVDQRKNEMVVYYLLHKYYSSVLAREARSKLVSAA